MVRVFFNGTFFSEFFFQKSKFLELVYSSNDFNHTKIFLLRLFKMLENQTEYSELEQQSFIKLLVDEKIKPYEIHGRMCDVYEEACLSQKVSPLRGDMVSLR